MSNESTSTDRETGHQIAPVVQQFDYRLNVLCDADLTVSEFVVKSPRKLDRRVLQLVGLLLDDGAQPEFIRRELSVAESYVAVIGETVVEEWIDKVLTGELV